MSLESAAKLRVLPFVALLLPLDIVVAGVILVADLVSFPLRFFQRRPVVEPPADVASVTIQILNWDGRHLLETFLPGVVSEAGDKHEVVVVDNGSTDGSVLYLRENFPNVRVVELDRNYGFSIGNNKGFQQVRSDVVILLNNDMQVTDGFLPPLLAPFSDPGVFAVAAQVFFSDPRKRREETGKTAGRFEKGFFRLWHEDVDSKHTSEAVPVFWVGGGACAIDARKLKSIGGFDALYHPFYVEDADISWQAWKRGWKCLFAPQSHVVHQHRGTSRPKFGDDFVDATIRRNQFLFVWKNVTAVGMMLRHLVELPRIHGSVMLQRGGWFEIRSYAGAVVRLPQAIRQRLANLRDYVANDRAILESLQ